MRELLSARIALNYIMLVAGQCHVRGWTMSSPVLDIFKSGAVVAYASLSERSAPFRSRVTW